MSATGPRILVLDDDPFDRELAARALAALAEPPEIVFARDWAEALPLVEGGGLDLLLLDYRLPGVTGLDILHQLRRRAHPPVVMMTGQGDVATAVETLRAGAHDYVPKSADWGPSLCLAVERVLERARLERELAAARADLALYAEELERKVAARTAIVRAQAAEVERLYLEAEAAARVKAEIVANVSHELRTPLSVILGYTDLLAEQLAGVAGEEAATMLAKVRQQADHLRKLVESLLALHRLNEGTEGIAVTAFDVGQLLETLRTEAELLNADRGLALAWTAPTEPCRVETDREKVRAIAYHLVSNAIKFTPVGRVEVAARPSSDGGIVLTVSDTGIGLPPDARETVFEEFRQGDGSSTRRYEGLGLGLGIVKRYTALLGGTIHVESAPGKGTTVEVTLPRVAPQPAAGG
jgi:signal transduction histidine kinase